MVTFLADINFRRNDKFVDNDIPAVEQKQHLFCTVERSVVPEVF